MDLDVPAFVGAEAGTFDVVGEAETERLAVLASGFLLSGELVPADGLARHLESLDVLAAVQLDAQPVGEEQTLACIRELFVPYEVASPDLEPVDTKLFRELIHRPLDREAGLRTTAATVRRHRHRRRVDRTE